jgi:hypothetical protein
MTVRNVMTIVDLGYEQTEERRSLVEAMDSYDGSKDALKQIARLSHMWLRSMPKSAQHATSIARKRLEK